MNIYDLSAWGDGRKNGSSIRKPASLNEPKENIPPMMQSIRNPSDHKPIYVEVEINNK